MDSNVFCQGNLVLVLNELLNWAGSLSAPEGSVSHRALKFYEQNRRLVGDLASTGKFKVEVTGSAAVMKQFFEANNFKGFDVQEGSHIYIGSIFKVFSEWLQRGTEVDILTSRLGAVRGSHFTNFEVLRGEYGGYNNQDCFRLEMKDGSCVLVLECPPHLRSLDPISFGLESFLIGESIANEFYMDEAGGSLTMPVVYTSSDHKQDLTHLVKNITVGSQVGGIDILQIIDRFMFNYIGGKVESAMFMAARKSMVPVEKKAFVVNEPLIITCIKVNGRYVPVHAVSSGYDNGGFFVGVNSPADDAYQVAKESF